MSTMIKFETANKQKNEISVTLEFQKLGVIFLLQFPAVEIPVDAVRTRSEEISGGYNQVIP